MKKIVYKRSENFEHDFDNLLLILKRMPPARQLYLSLELMIESSGSCRVNTGKIDHPGSQLLENLLKLLQMQVMIILLLKEE